MKQKILPLLLFLLIAALVLTGCGPTTSAASNAGQNEQAAAEEVAAAPQETRTLTAWVGAGQDTTVINAFLPSALRVRAGDTITWKLDTDEIHTVSFLGGQDAMDFELPLPGGSPTDLIVNPEAAFPTRLPGAPVEHYNGTTYINSGVMSSAPAGPDAPPNDTFSLTFDEPGLYPFVCLVHPYMQGVVVAEEATETDLPSQAEVDAQIETELQQYMAKVDAANAAGAMPRGESLADSGHLWYVEAGSNMRNPSAATFEFLTKELTVDAGDTVVWTSHEFHNIIFIPAPPAPPFVVPIPQEGGPPMLTLNTLITTPAKPNQSYDPTQHYSSGIIGPGLPAGSNWSLTFEQPGTYKYFCGVHREQGMEGTIIVKA